MKVVKYLNTTKKNVEKKEFNIFIGLSLGNKYFNDKSNVEEFIAWALDNSKNDVVILIPDTIHAINCEVRNGFSKTRASSYVKRKGVESENMVKSIIDEHFATQHSRISIIKFEAVEKDKDYQERKDILYNEFHNNPQFHDKIMEIVKESVNPDILKLTDLEYERLAAYPLDELPFLVAGFNYGEKIYDLVPYPGLSKIDYLIVDLQEGEIFPELTKKLKIQSKVAILEAYSE